MAYYLGTLVCIMIAMGVYAIRGGSIAFDSETTLEGRPAFIVGILLLIGAAAIIGGIVWLVVNDS